VANRTIRVYLRRNKLGGERLRVCWVTTGAAQTIKFSAAPVLDLVRQYRIAGRYFAAATVEVLNKPAAPGVGLGVGVWDAKRRKVVAGFLAQPPEPGATDLLYTDSRPGVTDLELTSGGAVAWIVSGRPNNDGYFSIQKADGTAPGKVVLDEGPTIDPDSLAIGGNRIYWVNAGQPRSAILHGRAHFPLIPFAMPR